MRSVKCLIAAGAASLLSTAAFAADMPIMPPPAYAPPPPAEFGGWYLRGDIGMTNQSMKSLHSRGIDFVNTNFPGSLQDTGFGFDSSPLFKLGVGYQLNNWFRADLTGEYRGKANFHGSQSIPLQSSYSWNQEPTLGNYTQANRYSGSKSEWVVMANAYVDLGTWWCVTPFVGAGVGASYNRISGFRDDGVIYNQGLNPALNNSVWYGNDAGKWNFAWAAHAGLAYKVTPNVTLELAYRYISLGDAVTGPTRSFDGSAVGGPFTMKDLTSHDLTLGVRWNLDMPAPLYAPPLITKG